MKKHELAAEKLTQYELIDRDRRKAEKRIAELREELVHAHNEARIARVRQLELLGRRMTTADRPWEAIKDRLVDDGKPMTWEEAVDAASCIWKVAMNLDPIPDVRRAVNLAGELKVVNDLVGLSDWPDDKFA